MSSNDESPRTPAIEAAWKWELALEVGDVRASNSRNCCLRLSAKANARSWSARDTKPSGGGCWDDEVLEEMVKVVVEGAVEGVLATDFD
jgi:hypothetical protein